MGAGSSCRSDFFNLTCLSPLPIPLVCRDVALSGRVQEPSVRLSLLEFAALHCSLEELEGVLHAHSLVEVEVGATVGLGEVSHALLYPVFVYCPAVLAPALLTSSVRSLTQLM